MRSLTQKLSAWTLLAIYGGVALLGHGLHWLSPHEHHHHGLAHVQHSHAGHSHTHGHGPHDDHGTCELAQQSTGPHPETGVRIVSVAAADGHDCDICEFLAQARSQTLKAQPAVVSTRLVSAVASAPQRPYTAISLDSHSPRGPPMIMA